MVEPTDEDIDVGEGLEAPIGGTLFATVVVFCGFVQAS